MAWIQIPGIEGLVYQPEVDPNRPRKHNCPDCFSCQMCSHARCAECRKTEGADGRACRKEKSKK